MKRRSTIAAALILTVILAVGFKGCGKEKGVLAALSSLGIPAHAANFQHTYRTPGGVNVAATQPIPETALAVIDQAIRLQISRINAARPSWVNHRDLSDYNVLLIDPTAYSEVDLPGAPLIRLHGGGTTAGTVIGILGTRKTVDRSYIVVPHQAGQRWQFMDFFFQAVRNESEHDRECNEPNRLDPAAECEQYSGWQDVHPHFP